MPDRSAPELFSRTAIGIAVGLGALLVVGVIVLGKVFGSSTVDTPPVATGSTAAPRTGPLPLVPVDAPDAGSAPCTALIGALPDRLTSGSTTLSRLPLAQPAPRATMAWGTDTSDPVVLRCGLGPPPELTPTSELRQISGVDWLPVQGDGASTWYLVHRPVYVALTVPAGTGTGVLQDVSETVKKTLASP